MSIQHRPSASTDVTPERGHTPATPHVVCTVSATNHNVNPGHITVPPSEYSTVPEVGLDECVIPRSGGDDTDVTVPTMEAHNGKVYRTMVVEASGRVRRHISPMQCG